MSQASRVSKGHAPLWWGRAVLGPPRALQNIPPPSRSFCSLPRRWASRRRCVAVEDAPADILAARNAGMAVLGIARLGDEVLLRKAGADLVVTNLDRIDLAALAGGILRLLPVMEDARMLEALQLAQEPGWILSHEGYSVLTESAVESRFAFGNGFLGMRAARSISRGPTWTSWLGYIRWASWPRCYLAGLFDTPNTEPPVPALVPIADWSRVRVLLDGVPLPVHEGGWLVGTRTLDMRRGVLLAAFNHRTEAGITLTEHELRLLSLADRAAGLQLQQFSVDRDGVDVRVDAIFGLAGLGMEPLRLEDDLGAWRTEGTGKSVAMTGAATLRLGGELLTPERPFPLRWVWRWRSIANQVAELDRLVTVARADAPDDDPAPHARAAL